MGVANYLKGLNLDPGTAEALTSRYGDGLFDWGPEPSKAATKPEPKRAPAPSGPVPGDPDFAASLLSPKRNEPQLSSSASAPAPRNASPAPGEPGFDILKVPGGHAASAPTAPTLKLPPGAGQIDTSGVAPRGFGSGAVHLSAKGKQPTWDLSGVSNASAPAPGADNAADAEADRAMASRVQPGVVVPGGWQNHMRNEERKLGMDPAALAEGKKQRAIGDNYGQWAADDMRSAMQKEAEADVAYATHRRDLLEADAARQQALANEKRQYVEAEHQKLATLSEAAQKQVDPEAAKGSAGAQLFAAIGIALGQFGASLTGGTNAALQIVNANIDRRIAAQQHNINNAHRSLANEQSLHKDNLEAFGDRERANLATRIQYLDQAKGMLDEQYAKAKSNRNDAQYHEMSKGLAEERAKAADQFGELTADKVATSGSQVYQPTRLVGGLAATGEAKKDAHTYSEELEKAGIPGQLSSLKDIDKSIDAMGSGDIAGVGRIKDHLPSAVLSDEGVHNRQVIQSLKNNIGHAKFGGALSPTEADKLDKELEGAHDAASLRTVVQSFRNTLSTRQRNIGAGVTPEGRALYEQRGGPVKDVAPNRKTTPTLKPVDE